MSVFICNEKIKEFDPHQTKKAKLFWRHTLNLNLILVFHVNYSFLLLSFFISITIILESSHFHRISHIATMFNFLNCSQTCSQSHFQHFLQVSYVSSQDDVPKGSKFHPQCVPPDVTNSTIFYPIFFAQNWTCITYKSELNKSTYILLFWGSGKKNLKQKNLQ